MISNGPNLGLLISAATGDQHDVAFRKLLRAVDALVLLMVKSRTLTAPPGSPANGDRYIVGPAPTGAWSGQAKAVAVWTTDDPATPLGYWEFHTPAEGWLAWSQADAAAYAFTGGAWAVLINPGSVVTSVAGRSGAVVLAEADVTSLTTDLAATEKTANKGAASGYASLDGTGHVPLAQIPASIAGALQYQGIWDASGNSPALASGVGTKGFFYKVSTAGGTTLDGNSGWHIGDLAIFDGTVWDKVDNYEAVTSVAGRTGAIVLAEADITGLVTDLGTLASSLVTESTAITTETTRAMTAEGLLAPKASPALTGTPTAPTATLGDDSTTIATTAFVENAIDNLVAADIPALAESGVTGLVSDLAAKAPLASPALTGNPTAPTQAALDNSTKLATTAYADAAVAVETTARGTAVTAEASARTTADGLLAPKASPALTGTPTAPTPAALDNSTKISTTAYSDAAVAVEKTRALAAEALLAPIANAVLTGGETLDNPTAATSTVAQSSPISTTSGRYWNGAASATDSWTQQVVIANGTNGASTLTLAHAGSTGNALVTVPAIRGSITGSASFCSVQVGNNVNSGFYGAGGNNGTICATGSTPIWCAITGAPGAGLMIVGNTVVLGFAVNTTSNIDIAFSRLAAGSLALGNGTAGDTSGNISAKTHTVTASAGAPTSAGTAGTQGQIIAFGGLLYFCSVTGAAGSAVWNKLNMTAV
jgi:hypothetical protein